MNKIFFFIRLFISCDVTKPSNLLFTKKRVPSFDSYAAFGVDSNLNPELQKKDDKMASYSCSWSSVGFEPSKSKVRQQLQLCLRFQDQGQLTYQIQVKMYEPKDKNHVVWGIHLKSIDLDCKSRDGSSFVDIQKVHFR